MLLKSINYWSFPGGDGTLEMGTFFRKAKQYRYDAVEACIGEEGALHLETDEATCRAYAAEAKEIGVPIASVASGIYWGYAVASETEEKREKAVTALEKMIRITSWLGARTLLTIPGAVNVFFQENSPTLSYDVVYQNATQNLSRVLPVAKEYGVTLGIENVWNKFLLSPLEMAQFIDSFHSPHIGAYLDVANILPYGYPEQWLRILGKRVAGIHFKDFRVAVGTIEGFVDLLEGDVNWPAVVQAIGEIGYDGPLVGEMIPQYKHYPEVRLANTSNAMDAILGR